VDARTTIRGVLHDEFAAEAAAGFPRLRRVPSTLVVRFLDYFDGLDSTERAELTDALADHGSYYFSPPVPYPYRGNAAWQRFAAAAAAWRLAGGVRYTGVKLLAALANDRPGSLEAWCRAQGYSGLALQPSDALAPDAAALVPVKTGALRKRIGAAFAQLFAPRVTEIGDGIWRYEGTLGESSVKLMLHYGRNIADAQFRYEVAVQGRDCILNTPGFCFEALFGVGLGFWDYVTEANVGRSVELLCELVAYVARLPERRPAGCSPERSE
jgi:hypothetical protein